MVVANIIVSISGMPKNGKSHLALSFPAPMTIFSFDIGLESLLRKFPDKEFDVKTYPIPIIDSVKGKGLQKEIMGIWNTFMDDLRVATESNAKTLVIDTATAVYEIARIARAGELGQENLLQFQYGEVYARMKSIIQRPRLAGQNLVLTHYLRDRYVDNASTGEKELDGWRHTEGEVDVVLTIRKERVSRIGKDSKPHKKTIFITTIKDNRYDPQVEGEELENANYDDLVAILGVAE